MDSRLKKILWFGISTALIAALIYFADTEMFIGSLREADVLLLLPAFVAGLSVFTVWGYTWYRIFQKTGIDLSYFESLRVFMAGTFMNSITPLGQFGGEPVMAYLITRNSDSSYEKGLSSVLSSDLINTMPVLTFVFGGALYMLLFQSLNQVVIQAAYLTLLATVVGGGLVYLLWFKAGSIENSLLKVAGFLVDLIGRGERYRDLLEEKLTEVEKSFAAVGEDPMYLAKTVIVAHLGFAMQVVCMYFIMLSLGYTPDLSAIYFVVALSGLANFSPTPGGSGTVEGAIGGLATVFFPAVDKFAVGLTIGILFRLTTYWPGLVLGYLAFNSLENGDTG